MISPKQKTFLNNVLSACKAPRSTIRNTTEVYEGCVAYSNSLKNTNYADPAKAASYLTSLGFERKTANGGPSSGGDFSADVYGDVWTHPNGAVVKASTHFNTWPSSIHVSVIAADEQLTFDPNR